MITYGVKFGGTAYEFGQWEYRADFVKELQWADRAVDVRSSGIKYRPTEITITLYERDTTRDVAFCRECGAEIVGSLMAPDTYHRKRISGEWEKVEDYVCGRCIDKLDNEYKIYKLGNKYNTRHSEGVI